MTNFKIFLDNSNFWNILRNMKSKKQLNVRQRKAIKGIIAGKPRTTAFREAGYTAKTAAFKSGPMLQKILESFPEIMDRKGISDDSLADSLKDGLEAMFIKTATFEGIITDQKSFIDFPTRHKYLETALKLKNLIIENIKISGSLSSLTDAELEAKEKALDEILKG
jgi:hypothetical protein